MADFRLSTRAAADLGGIARCTIETFGVEQARRYRDNLEACSRTLAENPRLGRSAERLRPGLRRFEHRSHAVFYMQNRDGIPIVRILHARMEPSRDVRP